MPSSTTPGAKALRSPLYVAFIADVVASRRIAGTARRTLQKRIGDTLDAVNQRFAGAIAAGFVITIGDEFQGLLRSPEVIPDLLRLLERELPDIQLRVGFGRGTLDTELRDTALGMDGPVWHRAREAIETAKAKDHLGGVFAGFRDDDDLTLNGLARLLYLVRSRLTAKQRLILDELLAGHTQMEVARRRRVSKQVVSKQAGVAGFEAYREGDEALRALLKCSAPPLHSKK
jgi:hypothetical protein